MLLAIFYYSDNGGQVEAQKYNNCGSEVIENFMQYLTGERVDQESAVAVHSMLLEDALIGDVYENS